MGASLARPGLDWWRQYDTAPGYQPPAPHHRIPTQRVQCTVESVGAQAGERTGNNRCTHCQMGGGLWESCR
jgi:hypothetical protein